MDEEAEFLNFKNASPIRKYDAAIMMKGNHGGKWYPVSSTKKFSLLCMAEATVSSIVPSTTTGSFYDDQDSSTELATEAPIMTEPSTTKSPNTTPPACQSAGYEFVGGKCRNINECELSSEYCIGGTCSDTEGSYNCICPNVSFLLL